MLFVCSFDVCCVFTLFPVDCLHASLLGVFVCLRACLLVRPAVRVFVCVCVLVWLFARSVYCALRPLRVLLLLLACLFVRVCVNVLCVCLVGWLAGCFLVCVCLCVRQFGCVCPLDCFFACLFCSCVGLLARFVCLFVCVWLFD